MAGTVEGGKNAADTNKQRYGEGFYKMIGKSGGLKSRGGGFAKNPDLAREAGRRGGVAHGVPFDNPTCVNGHKRKPGTWRVRVSGTTGHQGKVCLICERESQQKGYKRRKDAR